MQYDKSYLMGLLGEWQINFNDEKWQKRAKNLKDIVNNVKKYALNFTEDEENFFQNFYIEYSDSNPRSQKILDLSENFPHAEYFFIASFFDKNIDNFYSNCFCSASLREQKDKFVGQKDVKVGDVISGYDKNIVSMYIFIESIAKHYGDFADKSLKDNFKTKLIKFYDNLQKLASFGSDELKNNFFKITLHNHPYILLELVRTSATSENLNTILSLFSDEYLLNFDKNENGFSTISVNSMCELISLFSMINENIKICHFNASTCAIIGSLFDEKIADFKQFCVKSEEFYNKFTPFPDEISDENEKEIWTNLFFDFANNFDTSSENVNTIYYGCIGVGKTRRIINILKAKNVATENMCFCGLNPNYEYSDLIDGFCGKKFVNGAFKELCKKAINDPLGEYFLVLDNLQNADLTELFGGALLLFDLRYNDNENIARTKNSHYIDTLSPDEIEKFSVFVKNGKSYFVIPKNVRIFGTFDTNVGCEPDINSAKYFTWVKCECDYNELESMLNERGIKNYSNYIKAVKGLNDFLRKNYDFFITPFELGQGIFAKVVNYANDNIITKKSVDSFFDNDLTMTLTGIFKNYIDQKDIKTTIKVIKDNFKFE